MPAWAYEKARVCPPEPGWASAAATLRDRLAALLAPWLVAPVEHVGSTSVPGLAAKPILDLMAAVDAADPVCADGLDRVAQLAGDELAADGWCPVPPALDGRPWRRFYVLPDPTGQHRRAHLQLLRVDHPRWAGQLAFRDALRADAQLAARYAALKQQLAERHGADREAYTDAKADFIQGVLTATGA